MERTIEEHIGAKVALLREGREWNQRQLGEALEKATGKKWERQSVWAAERGKRAWAVVDLLGLADVFDVTVAEIVSTDGPLTVGGVTKSPRDIQLRTEGDAHLQGHWRTFHALAGVGNILRTARQEYQEMRNELRKQVQVNPELGQMIAEYRDKLINHQERRAIREAESDGEDVSTPEKLADYMNRWGHQSIPALVAARDVLEGDGDGEGK